jgi:Ca2+-binding RTX toxin-like protein
LVVFRGGISTATWGDLVNYPLARGRNPLWWDYDNDGRLDLVMTVTELAEAPATLFRQTPTGFRDVSAQVGFNPATVAPFPFAQLSDFNGDNRMELLTVSGSPPLTLYTVNNNNQLVNQPNRWFEGIALATPQDMAIADFNNDLRPDLYLATRGTPADLVQINPKQVNAYFTANQSEQGARFQTNGALTLEFPQIDPNEIFIGARGVNPTGQRLTLNANDPKVQGFPAYQPGVSSGFFIGYNGATQQWQVRWSRPNLLSTHAFFQSTEPITGLTALGEPISRGKRADQLLINTGDRFINRSAQAGLNAIPTAAKSVAAGDFDNDMDVDLYIVNSGFAGNQPNVLLSNRGNGTFVALPNAANAFGTDLGLGDTATVVDYDRDGALDLFVTNGSKIDGIVAEQFFADAPYQLFRNQGNDNHWLEVDLQGRQSNADGIGSKIYAKTGAITQLREQAGGMHNKAQDSPLIHFGLASFNRVNTLEVRWSSGIQQELANIQADQIVTVVEGEGKQGADRLQGASLNDRLIGFNSNDTLSGNSGNDILVGGNGDDVLQGSAGNDVLRGEGGGDFLSGDLGRDTCIGGAGQDLFLIQSRQDGGDVIQDFQVGVDTLQFRRAGFGARLPLGPLKLQYFQVGTGAERRSDGLRPTVGHRFIYDDRTGNLSFDPDGSGAAVQIELLTLGNLSRLSHQDILIV